MRSLPFAAGLAAALLLCGFLSPAASAATVEPPRVRLDGPLLPGAWLQVMPFRTPDAPRVFRWTDGAALILAGVPDGPALLCAGAEGRATRCVREWLEPGGTFLAPSPPPGVEVTGRVLLAQKPVAGAQIAFSPTDPTFPRFTLLPLAHDGRAVVSSVATGVDGRFALPHLAPGEYQVQVRAGGGRFGQLGPYKVPDPAQPSPPSLDLGDLVLQEGVAVEVTVADTAGKPIAGAQVSLSHQPTQPAARTPGEGFLFEAKTDARGSAAFLGLPPGEAIDVVCSADGYFPQARKLPAPEKTVRCTLSRPGRLEGKVVDPDGRPVAAATVALGDRSGPSARTAADGTFVLEEIHPGNHVLSVAAPRFRAEEREVSLAAEESRRLDPIQLTPAGGFAGRVIDGVTGEPVAGAALTVQEPAGAGGAVADAEGAFTLEAGADEPLLVQVEAAGYPPTPLRITPEEQRSPEPLTVRLLPGGRIHVIVWDEAADRPCVGCWVILTGPTGRGGRLTTDANGQILTGLLAPGAYSLMALTRNGTGTSRSAQVKPGETAKVTFGKSAPPASP